MTDTEIHDICYWYDIENYTINKDKSIDVDGEVHIIDRKLVELPLNFNRVTGDFLFNTKQLQTLKGSPIRIDGYCDLSNCNLVSLDYCPEYIGGDLYLEHNMLISLKNISKYIGGVLVLHDNQIRSLSYLPKIDSLHIYHNPVCELWDLFEDEKQIEYFNELDIITPDDKNIVLDRLNYFLLDIGKNELKLISKEQSQFTTNKKDTIYLDDYNVIY